jgi:hypothetical protein
MNAHASGQGNGYSYASFEGKPPASDGGNRFLWWCAGADAKMLQAYPTEHAKYAGIGGVMLATFVLAALSSGYAMYSVFGHIGWAALFALIWGLIIFNFDRFLVSTMRKYGVSRRQQWGMALPRVILAILIGVTIARPLELKIFEKEIDVQVTKNRHDKIALNDSLLLQAETPAKLRAEGERARLISRKQLLEDSLASLQQAYIREADGTGGSGKRGIEKLTKLKMDAFEQATAQYQPELSLLNQKLAVQDSILKGWEAGLVKKRADYAAELATKVGFLERNKALEDLRSTESSAWWATLMVSLLIILIEVGPILSKLIMPLGPYDMALAQTELMQMARSDREMVKDKALLQDKLDRIYAHKKEVSQELLDQVKELQRKKIKQDLADWDQGQFKAKSQQPLDDVMTYLQKQYGYEEDAVL